MVCDVILVLGVNPLLKRVPVSIRPLLSVVFPVLLLVPSILSPHIEQGPLLLGPVVRLLPHPTDHLPLGSGQGVKICQAFVVFPAEVLFELKGDNSTLEMRYGVHETAMGILLCSGHFRVENLSILLHKMFLQKISNEFTKESRPDFYWEFSKTLLRTLKFWEFFSPPSPSVKSFNAVI